jgi:two-component system, NarL family, nitrate/nitrite response regulator NarL
LSISQHSAHPMPTPRNGAMNNPTQESRIRLVLLDGHGLFRASLGRLLASEPDLEVAGECGTSAEALEVLKGSTVDVVLLDFDVGTEHGNDFISTAQQAGYLGRFLIVAGSADVRNSAIALKLGASGIFLKSETPERLLQAIMLVGNGGGWIDQRIIQLLADQLIDPHPRLEDQWSSGPLEDRERNVLLGILEGLTNRKIGDNMGLSESNIKNIGQRLFGKAGVKTRGQLVRVAFEGSLGAGQQFIQRQSIEIPHDAPAKSHEAARPLAANLPGDRQSHH